ncbi:MAG: carbohydrate ABC transporter permease [Ruminiclostridium sp.]
MSPSQSKYTKYLFIAPALITVLVLIIYPIIYGAALSLFNTNLTTRWDFTGPKNYKYIFENVDFIKSLLVTFKFTVIVVLGHFIFGTWFAVLLNKKLRFRAVFRSILMVPWLFPEIVFGVLWKWILNPMYGIFNSLLMQFNIIHTPISWLGSVQFAFPSMTVIAIWKGFPFLMLMVLAGLQAIPDELYEAGEIDGCAGFKAFRYITLPSVMPVLSVTLILDTVSWFKHFNLVSILTMGGPGNSTMLVSNYIYNTAFLNFNFGEASAMATIVFIICFMIGVFYKKFLMKKDD